MARVGLNAPILGGCFPFCSNRTAVAAQYLTVAVFSLPQTLSQTSLNHAAAARGGRGGVSNSGRFFLYLFRASFSNMKLKPGTMSAHLIFGSYEGVFFLCR